MKKIYFFVFALAVLLSACNQSSTNTTERPTSDSVVVHEQLEDQEVEYMANIINQIAVCLDSIQIQEDLLFKSDETTNKGDVLKRLRAFKDLLQKKQAQINALTANQKTDKATLANLIKMTDFMKKQLEEKSEQIAKLETAVQTKDAKISELRYDVNELSAESNYLKDQNYEQDKLLNQAFYIVGEKKELKELGLMSGGGLTKKRANYANIDQSKFKKVDIRGFEKLVIESKSPKLITEKPESSYTLTKNDDGTTTLQIIDAKAFWAASPYLIIQK